MSEEEMKALVEMKDMLKHENTKLKQDKQELQNEIDDLQRNCDVFNEQMNDAVERAMELNNKLNKIKEELLIWGEVMNPKLQNKLLQILNEGGK